MVQHVIHVIYTNCTWKDGVDRHDFPTAGQNQSNYINHDIKCFGLDGETCEDMLVRVRGEKT